MGWDLVDANKQLWQVFCLFVTISRRDLLRQQRVHPPPPYNTEKTSSNKQLNLDNANYLM